MKLGVISDCFRRSTEESIAMAAELGLDGIQIYAVSGDFCPERLSADDIRHYRKFLADRHLEVSALCGDLGGHGFERREDNAEKIRRTKAIVELACAFDCKVVTTHIGVIPADDSCERYGVMLEALRECGGYAHSHGVTLAIETGPEVAPILNGFVRAAGGGVGVNLDPANLVMVTGCDPVAAVYTLKDFIVHTHAKDGVMLQQADTHKVYNFFAEGGIGDLRLDEYFKELPLGDGDVPFDKYLDALEDIGYSGFLTVERECGADPYADIKRAVDYLKSNINA